MATTSKPSDELFRQERAFLGMAVACGVGMIVVPIVARPDSPNTATIAVLFAIAMLFTVGALALPDGTLRRAIVVIVAALALQTSYFFGPLSLFGGVLVFALVFSGMLGAAEHERASRVVAWLILIVIAGGQLGLVILVACGVLRDRSLFPTILPGHPASHSVLLATLVDGIYVGAFIAGRACAHRYHQLVATTASAIQSAVVREALIAEACDDYERALVVRQANRPPRSPTKPPTEPSSDDMSLAPTSEVPAARSDVKQEVRAKLPELVSSPWEQALRARMRWHELVVLGLATIGAAIVLGIAQNNVQRLALLGAAATIAGLLGVRQIRARNNSELAMWPWVAISGLSALAAYAIGLHSAFVALVITSVILQRLFRSANANVPDDLSLYSLVALCAGNAFVFVAILAGWIPDAGLMKVLQPGTSGYSAMVGQIWIQGMFVVAHVAGNVIDARISRAVEVANTTFRIEAEAAERLRVARTQLANELRAEEAGLFTGTEVGTYRVGKLIGVGGMAEVYRAEKAGVVVALKVVRAERFGDSHYVELFEHEARLHMRLDSPHVARLVDAQGGAAFPPYLALEYVDGPSLTTLLHERGRLTGDELLRLVIHIARGVEDIHAAGLLHLDLKPSNLLFGNDRWRIVDFGVARAVEDGLDPGRIAGTPQYMAPEQALGGKVGRHTDLYSLGLVFYRACVGRPAFVGTDAGAIAERASMYGPPDPRGSAPIANDVALVLRIALAFDDEDRFASASELSAAFTSALMGSLDGAIRTRGLALLRRAPWDVSADGLRRS